MPYTILIVDDDPLILKSLKRSMRKEKFNILCANSAKEALEILENKQIDLVITDHDMPGTRGVDLLIEVKKLYPETIRFMLTGKATLEVALDAINKGAITRFFTKPCNSIELAVAIRQALQQKDLLEKSKLLLNATRRQSYLLEKLEKHLPGITCVKRDNTGAILLDEENDEDIEKFLTELGGELVRVEKQMQAFEEKAFWGVKK